MAIPKKCWGLMLALLCSLSVEMGVAQAQTVVFGAEDDWFPLTAERDGKAVGLAVDVIREAYALEGVNVEFRTLPYALCMSTVAEAEQTELAGCFNTSRNPILDAKYFYGKEHLFQTPVNIYAVANSKEAGLTVAALEGKRVGVVQGYEYGVAFDVNTKIIKIAAAQERMSFSKLQGQQLDYVVAYDATVRSILREQGEWKGAFKMVGKVADTKLFLSFAKNYPDVQPVMDKLDSGIRKLKASGRYDIIFRYWVYR